MCSSDLRNVVNRTMFEALHAELKAYKDAFLLEAVLRYTRNNQTLASTVLGLNRGTLRKKLKRYGLL